MGLRIATNITALNAQRQLSSIRHDTERNFERLSSGTRINRAADDAAGLAISESLRAQIRGIRQAKRNTMDGVSLVQVSEGGLNEISNILIRLRELSVQASSDTIGDTERQYADREFQTLKEEIDRIAKSTHFNGTPLLNGKGGEYEFQIGTRNNPFLDRITYNTEKTDASLDSLKIRTETVSNKQSAQVSIGSIDEAMHHINSIRAEMGALQNRLTSTISNQAINEENLSAANSRIRDADFAEEVSNLTKNNILTQSGISVLSQANSSSQATLKLLS